MRRCETLCTKEAMIHAIKTKMHWEGILRWEAPRKKMHKVPWKQPMDLVRFIIGEHSLKLNDEVPKYLVPRRILNEYVHIFGEKGAMVAWKHLVRNPTYKKKAARSLLGSK